MIWHIVRVRRNGKPLRGPEIMHNRIEADTRLEALRQYHQLAPGVKLDDLEARVA